MNNRTSTLSLLLIIFISYQTFSQQSFNNNIDSEFISSKTINLKEDANTYTGSPYFNEEFVKGNIYKSGELLASNKKIRYNANKDYFEIQNNQASDSDIVNMIFRKNNLSIKTGIKELLRAVVFYFLSPSMEN